MIGISSSDMRHMRSGAVVRGAALSLLFVLLCRGAAVGGASDDVAIQANVAGLFVGEEKVVDGTVTTAQADGNTVHLHLGESPQDLTVSLILSLLSNFPAAPERYYLGKRVRVGGRIRSFRGRPEMVIRDRADIQELDSGTGRAAAEQRGAGSGQPQEASGLQQRVESLGERVQQLEERIRQLEHGGSDVRTQ